MGSTHYKASNYQMKSYHYTLVVYPLARGRNTGKCGHFSVYLKTHI